jgi:hypothetical protein
LRLMIEKFRSTQFYVIEQKGYIIICNDSIRLESTILKYYIYKISIISNVISEQNEIRAKYIRGELMTAYCPPLKRKTKCNVDSF